MENDIISNIIINDSTARIIKRLYRFASVFIFIISVYVIFELAYLYLFYRRFSASSMHGFRYLYFYWIFPISGIITLFVQFSNGIFLLQGYRLMVQSIESNDTDLLNKSLKKFYIGMIFCLISGIIAVINAAARFLLYN